MSDFHLPAPTLPRHELLIHGTRVVLQPLTLREADAALRGALPSLVIAGAFTLVEGHAPDFPATPEGTKRREAWWAALTAAAETLRASTSPTMVAVDPAAVIAMAEQVGGADLVKVFEALYPAAAHPEETR